VRYDTRFQNTMQCTVATNLHHRGATLPGSYFARKQHNPARPGSSSVQGSAPGNCWYFCTGITPGNLKPGKMRDENLGNVQEIWGRENASQHFPRSAPGACLSLAAPGISETRRSLRIGRPTSSLGHFPWEFPRCTTKYVPRKPCSSFPHERPRGLSSPGVVRYF